MTLFNKIAAALVLLIIPSISVAAPNVTGVSGGVISGTGFTTNSAVDTSSLQYNGINIEAGTTDGVFTQTGWGNYVTTETSESAVARYSTDQAHSGSKSIELDYTSATVYKGSFYRDHGSSITRVYISFWVRSSGSPTTGQWKIWRLKQDTSFVDGQLDFMQNSFHPDSAGGARIASLYQDAGHTSNWDCNGCANEPATNDIYMDGDTVPGPNAVMDRWVRMEYWIENGTAGNYDGTFIYKFHDPDHPTTPVIKDVPKLTFDNNLMVIPAASSEIWQAAIFGGASVDGMDLMTHWDDVYIQVGGWARVEIGNASTWAACTHREVQLPTAWSTTEITYTEQQGSLPDGTAYLYIVDENGDVNASGYEITLGATYFSNGSMPNIN